MPTSYPDPKLANGGGNGNVPCFRCWCSACDLTDGDLNNDYDRHGDGSCTTPCAGDPSSRCGGDMAFDLFLTGNCGGDSTDDFP